MQPGSKPAKVEVRELERRVAECAQLVSQDFSREAVSAGALCGRSGIDSGFDPSGASTDPERLVQRALDHELERLADRRRLGPHQPLGLASDRRIARHPNALPRSHLSQVGTRRPETQDGAVAASRDSEDRTPRFVRVLRMSGIEDNAHSGPHVERRDRRTGTCGTPPPHAGQDRTRFPLRTCGSVAERERPGPRPAIRIGLDLDFLRAHPDHASELDAAVLRKASLDQRLVIAAGEEAVAEAARVRERHRQQVGLLPLVRFGIVAAPRRRRPPNAGSRRRRWRRTAAPSAGPRSSARARRAARARAPRAAPARSLGESR